MVYGVDKRHGVVVNRERCVRKLDGVGETWWRKEIAQGCCYELQQQDNAGLLPSTDTANIVRMPAKFDMGQPTPTTPDTCTCMSEVCIYNSPVAKTFRINKQITVLGTHHNLEKDSHH